MSRRSSLANSESSESSEKNREMKKPKTKNQLPSGLMKKIVKSQLKKTKVRKTSHADKNDSSDGETSQSSSFREKARNLTAKLENHITYSQNSAANMLIESQQESKFLQKKVAKLQQSLNIVAMTSNNKEKDCERLESQVATLSDVLG